MAIVNVPKAMFGDVGGCLLSPLLLVIIIHILYPGNQQNNFVYCHLDKNVSLPSEWAASRLPNAEAILDTSKNFTHQSPFS